MKFHETFYTLDTQPGRRMYLYTCRMPYLFSIKVTKVVSEGREENCITVNKEMCKTLIAGRGSQEQLGVKWLESLKGTKGDTAGLWTLQMFNYQAVTIPPNYPMGLLKHVTAWQQSTLCQSTGFIFICSSSTQDFFSKGLTEMCAHKTCFTWPEFLHLKKESESLANVFRKEIKAIHKKNLFFITFLLIDLYQNIELIFGC